MITKFIQKVSDVILIITLAFPVLFIIASSKVQKEDGKLGVMYSTEDMRTLTYKGHRYICYRFNATEKAGASIVHDPDCPCGKH